jgi:hypothetical protein
MQGLRIVSSVGDPGPEFSPPDPDPALVMYIYKVIVTKKMFLSNFLYFPIRKWN